MNGLWANKENKAKHASRAGRGWRFEVMKNSPVDKTQSFDKDANGLSTSEDQGPSLHTHYQNPKILWDRFGTNTPLKSWADFLATFIQPN